MSLLSPQLRGLSESRKRSEGKPFSAAGSLISGRLLALRFVVNAHCIILGTEEAHLD